MKYNQLVNPRQNGINNFDYYSRNQHHTQIYVTAGENDFSATLIHGMGMKCLFLIIMVLLSGCSGISNSKTTESTLINPNYLKTTQVPTLNLVFTPTIKITPLTPPATVKPMKVTPFQTVTPTIPAETKLKIKCLTAGDQLLPGVAVTGTVVLFGYLNGISQNPSYILDLYTGSKTILKQKEDEFLADLTISPSGKWLAYKKSNLDASQLEVIQLDRKTTITIPWEKDWEKIVSWVDDQRLLIGLMPEKANEPISIVINPFTKERVVLKPILPYLEQFPNGADWWGPAVYDPPLTRIVYPRNPGNDGRIVLWDLEKRAAIAYLQSYNNPYGGVPKWAEDGSKFIMTLQNFDANMHRIWDELYEITRDGKVTRLTNLEAFYSKILLIGPYSWSPDMSHIAFWIEYGWGDSLEKGTLEVLDLNTLEVTDYCIEKSVNSEPAWSPNSAQFMIEQSDRVLLIDIKQELAIKIIDRRYKPVGWGS